MVFKCKESFEINSYQDDCICAESFTIIADRCQCQPTQFVSSNNRCSLCPANATCDGKSATCKEGFQLINDFCKAKIWDCTECNVETGSCFHEGDRLRCSYGTVCETGFDIADYCRTCLNNYEPKDDICAILFCPNEDQFLFESECIECDINGKCDGISIICL